MGDAADVLGVSAPAATKNIDKLERYGLVVRGAPAGDRRATPLGASPEGRALVRHYDELKAERVAPILAQHAPETIGALADLLERFAVALLQLERSTDACCLRCAAYIDVACPVGRERGGCPYLRARAAPAARGPTTLT